MVRVPIAIKRVGCVVMCDRTPMIELATPGKPTLQISGLTPERVEPTLLRHFRPRGLWPLTGNNFSRQKGICFS